MVESFGAFTTFTVIEPGVVISFDAHNVFNSWCPERMISLLAPSDRCMSYENSKICQKLTKNKTKSFFEILFKLYMYIWFTL